MAVAHCFDSLQLKSPVWHRLLGRSRDRRRAPARRVTLVSEDLAHGQDYGGVRVFNPFGGS
jgi:hypothetical protein